MNKTQSGREEFYEQMVRSHSANLYRFAVRMCGSPDTAEDLIQETFYQAWKSIHTLRDPSRARAWLYQILKHCHAHWLRKEKRTPNADTLLSSLEDTVQFQHAAEKDPVERHLEKQTLQKALDALNLTYKEPFLMVYLAGFTCRETAALLDLPMGTVLSRIHRARTYLRQFLKEYEHHETRSKTDKPGMASQPLKNMKQS